MAYRLAQVLQLLFIHVFWKKIITFYIFNLGLFYHMLEDIMIIINAIIIF